MKELTKITEPKTLAEIVKVAPTLPTIGKLIREGDKEIEVLAFKTIIQIFEFYNEKLNESELTDYIREPNHPKPLILEQFLNQAKQITKPEILIFRDNCLEGKYPLKFRLTPNVFIDWLKEYQFQRMEAFENANLKAKIEAEKQPISEKTTEMLKKLAETVKPQPLYSTDVIPESDYIKEAKKKEAILELEFEKVWKEQGCKESEGNNPQRYVEVDGWFDVMDYSIGKVKKQFISGRPLLKRDYVEFKFEELNKIIK